MSRPVHRLGRVAFHTRSVPGRRAPAVADGRAAAISDRRARAVSIRRGLSADRGSAVIEFGLFFLIVLVPLLYLLFTAASIQRTMLGTASAAEEAARVYVTAETMSQASDAAGVAAGDVLSDYGLAGHAVRTTLDITCVRPDGSSCGEDLSSDRGAEVIVTVRCDVPLTRIPFIGLATAPYLPVTATERAPIDQFRGF